MTGITPPAKVRINPPKRSKINGTAAVTAALSLIVAFGIPIDEQTKTAIVTGLTAAGSVLIMI